MKYRHYAPVTPLLVLRAGRDDMVERIVRSILWRKSRSQRVALLAPEICRGCGADVFFSLGSGTPVDYARMIYAGLRELDTSGADVILCPGIEPLGVGYAVMNRLRKAATRVV
jgi:L-threonylcarbamoyladenylate synthase